MILYLNIKKERQRSFCLSNLHQPPGGGGGGGVGGLGGRSPVSPPVSALEVLVVICIRLQLP